MMEAFGRWRLASVIAVGGLGEIWRAERGDDPRDGVAKGGRAAGGGVDEPIALKRLHSHLVRNADARALFAHEQQLACALPRHPNVVHGVEAGDVDGRPYVALVLARGEDLRRQLAPPPTPDTGERPGRAASPIALPRRRALQLIAAACDGAAHLHAHGVVHGDINPSNLVVASNDHVTLVDLGVARRIGEAGAVRGTHAYMAPEQVRGEAWTEASDVFALGVVLWELVAGARLFHRGPPWLSMTAVVEDAAPPLAEPALDDLAQAALAKEPAKRIARAKDLAAQLRALA